MPLDQFSQLIIDDSFHLRNGRLARSRTLNGLIFSLKDLLLARICQTLKILPFDRLIHLHVGISQLRAICRSISFLTCYVLNTCFLERFVILISYLLYS